MVLCNRHHLFTFRVATNLKKKVLSYTHLHCVCQLSLSSWFLFRWSILSKDIFNLHSYLPPCCKPSIGELQEVTRQEHAKFSLIGEVWYKSDKSTSLRILSKIDEGVSCLTKHCSLLANVLWDSFVTHEMNAWQTNPKGRRWGRYKHSDEHWRFSPHDYVNVWKHH